MILSNIKKISAHQIILLFCFFKLVLHFTANANYGFHADELLYLSLADHLSWGYKEISPLIAFIAWLSEFLPGNDLFAARLIPTLASVLVLFFTGKITLLLGGGRLAVLLTCLAILISPSFLASSYFLQPVVFDQLLWTLLAYSIVNFLVSNQTYWIYLSALFLAFGIITKYTIVLFAAALFVSLILSAKARKKINYHFFIAAFLCLIICLPNILWQLNNDLPILKHMQELKASGFSSLKPIAFITDLLLAHASAMAIWLAGFFLLLLHPDFKPYRFLSFAFLLVIGLLIIVGGKTYYSFGAFTAMFAAGGVCWEMMLVKTKKWLIPTVLGTLILPFFIYLPAVIPILSFKHHLQYFELMTNYTAIRFPLTWDDKKVHKTTQFYAEMLGWNELAAKVSNLYDSLSPEQKKQTVIFANNYAQAGALHYYRDKYDLPRVISLKSSFVFWAPENINARYIIFIKNGSIGELKNVVKTALKSNEIKNVYAKEFRTGIWLLTDPKPAFKLQYFYEMDKRK